MIDPVRRSLRWIGSALVLATAPLAALSATEAAAQVPGMAMPGMPEMAAYPLTSDLVANWAASYPAILAATEVIGQQNNVPTGDDPVAALMAYAAITGAMDQLNSLVSEHGFTDYQQWLGVTLSVIFSFAILEAPADQQPMLLGMFGQPQENLDAVAANIDAVRTVTDNL
jgi:hypothetical protein